MAVIFSSSRMVEYKHPLIFSVQMSSLHSHGYSEFNATRMVAAKFVVVAGNECRWITVSITLVSDTSLGIQNR
jgi:hypothetical protein